MIKRLFTYIAYIAALTGLASCSDEVFDAPRTDIPENGEIPVAFNVPEMSSVLTRGVDESKIGELTMLIFDGPNGSLIKDPETLTLKQGKTTISIPEDYRDKGGLHFLFYANVSDADKMALKKGADINEVREKRNTRYSTASGADELLTMTGTITLSELLQLTPVTLYRNAAKVTVAANPEYGTHDRKFEYHVYGTAESSPFLAGTYNFGSNAASNFCGEASEVNFVDFGNPGGHNVDAATYVHPTLNKEGENLNASYVMVRSQSSDKSDDNYYYYCLQFQTLNDGVLDILPNHHYEFLINPEEIGKGYTTQEDAAENPIPLSNGMFTLYDHSPQVYNIITDGVRALGVSDKVLNTGDRTMQYLYVKVYSTTDDAEKEYEEFEARYKELVKFADNTWVSLGEIEKITDDEDILGKPGNNTVNDIKDGDTEGAVYRIECIFTSAGAGSQTTSGTVTWKGLSRRFDVIWDRSFKAEDLYESVTASFSGNSYSATPAVSGNYFDWIAGKLNEEGTAYLAGKTPKVWGADAKANNGDPRDQGLHFPIQGGGSASYRIVLQDLGGGEAYSWSYSFEGDNIEDIVTISGDAPSGKNVKKNLAAGGKPSFTISGGGGNDNYRYAVANMVIRVEKSARDVEIYRIPLYHTGFFMSSDKESGETVKDKEIGLAKALETGRDWTYYEIVSINRVGKTYRILDRNLGAHSAEMYVEATGDVTYAGNPQAAGGYYRVAGYAKEAKPLMKEDRIGAPANFVVPQREVFDDIRNSSNFSMAAVGNYYTAVYTGQEYGVADERGIKKRKNTYFPKARYLGSASEAEGYANLNAKQGDSRAGYYWTATASSGLEKEDIGAWLDCFTLSGSSASYTRGEVYCGGQGEYDEFKTQWNEIRKGPITGYAMPVRLVLSSDNSAGDVVHETNFFVKGATHVFLYTLDGKGQQTPVTSWPGYSICTENDAKSNKKFNFRYESKVNANTQLYAIFNYKTASGAIFSMSYNNGDIKIARFTDAVSPKSLVGFNLGGSSQSGYTNGKAPDVTAYGEGAPVAIENGVTWSFNFDITSLDNSIGGIGETAPVEPEKTYYRIYWPYSSDWSGINVWYEGKKGYVDSVYGTSDYNNGAQVSAGKDQTVGWFHKSPTAGYAYWETAEENFNPTNWQSISSGSAHSGTHSISISQFAEDAEGVLSVTLKSDGSVASGGPTGGAAPTPGEGYTIFYTNPHNWGNVYIWVMDSSHKSLNSDSWPGASMTKSGENYTYKLPKDAAYIIFNNGSSGNDNQTADVTVVQEDNHVYSDYVTSVTNGDVVAIPGDYNVAYSGTYCEKEKTYVHCYGGDSNSTWPGIEMARVSGSDGKSYKVAKVINNTQNVIFHAYEGTQTKDLSYSGSFIMDDDGATAQKVIFVKASKARRKAAVSAKAKSRKR